MTVDSTQPTPEPAAPADSETAPESGSQPNIRWLRFLDFAQSLWNRSKKTAYFFLRYGPEWRNCQRSGRRFVRVRFDEQFGWRHYRTPGWEWNCQNCHDYSIITEGMLPGLIREWSAEAFKLRTRGLDAHIKPRPTAARAGCPNCKFIPGWPE